MGCSSSAAPNDSSGCRVSNDFHRKYLLGKKLNSLSYGEVYAATFVPKGKYAFSNDHPTANGVKIVDLQMGPRVAKLAANEITRWKKLGQHENISQLHEVIYASVFGHRLCYIVMEACNSTLLDYLDSIRTFNERVLAECFAPMLSALKFMHANSLAHRDIKPDAFRIGGWDGCTVKLGDFGNSVVLEKEKIKGECGVPIFMAPEMISGEGYNEKVDVWSLGVLVYILLFGGRLPYTTKDKNSGNDIKIAISSNQVAPSFSSTVDLSCGAVAFAMSLLDRDPSNRPSAKDALKKSYMVSVKDGTYELGTELPCLRFGLIRAKKTKVLEVRDESSDMGINSLLNKMQMEAFGVPLPLQRSNSFKSTKSGKTVSTTASRGLMSKSMTDSDVPMTYASSMFDGPSSCDIEV